MQLCLHDRACSSSSCSSSWCPAQNKPYLRKKFEGRVRSHAPSQSTREQRSTKNIAPEKSSQCITKSRITVWNWHIASLNSGTIQNTKHNGHNVGGTDVGLEVATLCPHSSAAPHYLPRHEQRGCREHGYETRNILLQVTTVTPYPGDKNTGMMEIPIETL